MLSVQTRDYTTGLPQQEDHRARLSPLETLTIPSYRAGIAKVVMWGTHCQAVITNIVTVGEREVGGEAGVYLLYVVARNVYCGNKGVEGVVENTLHVGRVHHIHPDPVQGG